MSKLPPSYVYLAAELQKLSGTKVRLVPYYLQPAWSFHLLFVENGHKAFLPGLSWSSNKSPIEDNVTSHELKLLIKPPMLSFRNERPPKKPSVRFELEGIDQISGISWRDWPIISRDLYETHLDSGLLPINCYLVEKFTTMWGIEEAQRKIEEGNKAALRKTELETALARLEEVEFEQ